MDRRRFLLSSLASALAAPVAAEAQQAGRVYRVGLVAILPVAEIVSDPTNVFNSAFRREMRDRGYVEGQNLFRELRSVEGRVERASEVVAELVRVKVDVIVTASPEMTRRAQRVTTTVPIVTFVRAPVEEGLVVSLARPGGNITGLTNDTGPEMQGKLLGLLREGVPKVRRVAYLGHRAEWDGPGGMSARATARAWGLGLFLAEPSPNDYTRAFESIVGERPDAMMISQDAAHYHYRRLIAEFAARNRLPSLGSYREFAEAGGLLSYGIDNRDIYEDPERFFSLAAELAQMKVDVLIAVTRQAAVAAQRASKTIPTVFVAVPDPLGSGLVSSLGRPGGNITGLTNMAVELVPKRVEVLKEALPKLSRIALLVNAGVPQQARRYVEVAQSAARPLGLTVQPIEIRTPSDIEPAFAAITQNRLQALCLTSDGLIYVEQERLAQFALARNVPLIGYTREMAQWTGVLMTYGASNVALFKRAAYFVDRILKGSKPGDLPVEQPTVIEVVINLKTAKTLGLTIPPSLLARADQVIE